MRKITVQPPDDAKWRRWLKDCRTETDRIQELADRGEHHTIEFNDKLYSRRKEFFKSNEAPFYGKCTYCESSLSQQRGDIEHFRPKAAVTDEWDRPIDHPGYYWLAYDWRNLIPACTTCNQSTTVGDRTIGKQNRFPVIGQHAQRPAELDQEQPLLINPASGKDEDDPALHMEFDPTTGYFAALTPRGQMCIDIFGLNDIDDLVSARRDARRATMQLIFDLVSDNNREKNIQEIQEIRQGKKTFSIVRQAVIEKFEANWKQAIAAIPNSRF
jgi:5-methylcytosine-specific restriction endonuclease McrA